MDEDDELSVRPGDRAQARPDVAAMVAQVEPAKAADEDEAVAPQRSRARSAPVQKTRPTRRLQPGDLICGQCGEGNPPGRKFCSRCGDELATAAVVSPPWWQRLMFWRRLRKRKVAALGTRPGQHGGPSSGGQKLMGVYRKVRAVIAAVLFAAGMVYLFVPGARGWVNETVGKPIGSAKDSIERKIKPRYVPVRPVERAATAAVPDHGGELAFDQFSNTYWAAPWAEGQDPRLVLVFDRPMTISRIIVTSGAGDDFAVNHRPSLLHLVYSNNQSDDLRPVDGATPQTFELVNAKDITRIEIGVPEVYRAQDSAAVAIAEIELFAKE